MKNKTKFAGIIALAAFIGFTQISCKDTLNDKTVDDPQLERIAVTTQPTKNQYSLNESLNITGMVVTAYYSDGSSEVVPSGNGGYTTSGFSSSAAGSKTVTVTYKGETATFTVMVNAPGKTLSSIAVTTQPAKTQYNLNETLNTAGMVVTATFSDNSTEVITAGYTTGDFDSSTAGNKIVTVSYGGKNTSFTVTVVDPNPTVTPVTSWKGLTVPSRTTAKQHSSYQGKTDVLHVAPTSTASGYDWSVLSYSLDAYKGQEITITVSMQVWLDVSTKVAWQVNVGGNSYPVIAGSASTPLTAGQWHTVQGSATVTLANEANKALYLSKDQLVGGNPATIGTPIGNVEIYITGFTVTINGQGGNPDPNVLLHTKWPFKVGAAAPGSAFDTNNGQYPLLKQFNVLVAENDMKPAEVMPWNKPSTFPASPLTASQYRWTNADKLVSYAKASSTAIRGHVLIWHSQTPDWWYMDASNNLIGKNELYTRMENHIKIMFEKYKGDILWWDVVNEVVAEGGGPRAPRPAGDTDTSKSYYTQIMQDAGLSGFDRYEFVLRAFQYARQYANANGGTNVKLYLTDYNTEYTGAKQTEFLGLLDYLIQNNAPIDGVGFQSHIQYDWPSVNDISTAIDAVTAKQRSDGVKLTAQVCELDMTLFKWNGESTKATLTTAEYDERIALQTTKYRALFEMFQQKYNQNKLDAVLVWGLDDGHSWLNDRVNHTRVDYPLLFDRQYQPKAAYNELVR